MDSSAEITDAAEISRPARARTLMLLKKSFLSPGNAPETRITVGHLEYKKMTLL